MPLVQPLADNELLFFVANRSDDAQYIAVHLQSDRPRCASGCVVECRICNWEVAGSNLSLGYFAPKSTQPSIPPGSVNEYQLRLGRQRQVWIIPITDERVGVHCAGKTVKSLENTCLT